MPETLSITDLSIENENLKKALRTVFERQKKSSADLDFIKIENENCEPRNYSRDYFLDNLLTAIDSHCIDVMRLFVFALLTCQCHVRTSLSQNRVRSLCSFQCERARL